MNVSHFQVRRWAKALAAVSFAIAGALILSAQTDLTGYWAFRVKDGGVNFFQLQQTGEAITSVAPDTAAIGQCVSMSATTSSPFASWGTSPFVAYSYAVATGTEENPGPPLSETRTVALTADMFAPLADDSSSFQLDFDLCLPANAIAGTGLVAPGGMLSGQPSAWVYPGATFTIRSLWNAGYIAFDSITPSEITRGRSVDVTLNNADGYISDGARALAQFNYTVSGTAKTRTAPHHIHDHAGKLCSCR